MNRPVPETNSCSRNVPHPDKLGIVIRVCPQASVESSANVLGASLTMTFPLCVVHVTQIESGGTPGLGLQLASLYQTSMRSRLGWGCPL